MAHAAHSPAAAVAAWRLDAADVAAAPGFEAALDELARATGRESAALRTGVLAHLHELRTGHSPWLYRRIVAAGRALLRSGYEAIDYDTREVARARDDFALHPCVVLASHRSYLDGGALTAGFAEHDLPPLTVFGGINMAFWPVGTLWRRANGVFIRRGGSDAAYRFALRRTVGALLARRRPLQWFVEGTRSRTGRFGEPKLGLLHYVVEAWREGGLEDVRLLPVAIAYDRLREVTEYAQEAAGLPKRRESLGWLWRFVRGQKGRRGRVYVRFGAPVSLNAVLGAPSALPVEASAAHAATARLAQAVMTHLARAMPITGTTLVCRVLQPEATRPVALVALCRRVRAVASRAAADGLPLVSSARFGADADVTAVVDALAAEGVLVREAGGAVRATREGAYAVAWYANGIAHHPLADGSPPASQVSTSA